VSPYSATKHVLPARLFKVVNVEGETFNDVEFRHLKTCVIFSVSASLYAKV